MRQRAFPVTAGHLQGNPALVFAPHRLLAITPATFRVWVDIAFIPVSCPVVAISLFRTIFRDVSDDRLAPLVNMNVLDGDLLVTAASVSLERLRLSRESPR